METAVAVEIAEKSAIHFFLISSREHLLVTLL
jgi:hypothetical protein